MNTFVLLAVIFVAMGSQDVLQALYQRFMNGKRFGLAGHADGLMDVCSFLFVVGAITDHPRTLVWLVEAGITLYGSSLAGTLIGARFHDWIESHL